MPTTYTAMICTTTALVAATSATCTAGDSNYAELTSCTGVGTLEVTAYSGSNEVTNTDSDIVKSLEDLPLSLEAESYVSSAGISASMSMGATFDETGADDSFTLTYSRNADCGVICGGCGVTGSGEMVLDFGLKVNRPTKMRITRYAYWDLDLYPEVILQADGEEPRTLYDPATGQPFEGGGFEEFEIRPGTYVINDELRFIGCGPYGGDTESVGGYIQLECTFTESDLPADTNLDGVVDGADLSNILGNWSNPGGRGDINGDGMVNGIDLAIALGSWT